MLSASAGISGLGQSMLSDIVDDSKFQHDEEDVAYQYHPSNLTTQPAAGPDNQHKGKN